MAKTLKVKLKSALLQIFLVLRFQIEELINILFPSSPLLLVNLVISHKLLSNEVQPVSNLCVDAVFVVPF